MCELGMLKQLTWFYVIDHPSMTTPQRGQRQLIRSLFIALMSWTFECLDDRAAENRLPVLLRQLLTDIRNDAEATLLAKQGTQGAATRLKMDGLTAKAAKNLESANQTAPGEPFLVRRAVIDYIASLTELQAIRLHERLTTAAPLTDLDRWLGS
jgi:dGTPase